MAQSGNSYNRVQLNNYFYVSHIVEISYRGIPAETVIDRAKNVDFWCFYYVDRGKAHLHMKDGEEYELEVLTSLEYKGCTYLAVIPAGMDDEENASLEVSILKNVEEDGEMILCAIEDEQELKAVYDLIMEQLYEEDEDEK